MIINTQKIKEVSCGDCIYLAMNDNYEILITKNRRSDAMTMHQAIEMEIYHKEDEEKKLLRIFYYNNDKVEIYYEREKVGTCYIVRKSEKELYVGTKHLDYTFAFLKDIGNIINVEVRELNREVIFRKMFML